MRGWISFVLVCLCLALGATSAAAGDAREAVREAAEAVYIHGMTAEIAHAQVGVDGIPYLLELLEDPEFVRRDNIVTFLAYLGYDSETQPLLRLIDDPPAEIDARPEELRARLLVPEALGRIAARGGDVARMELERLRDRADLAVESSLSEMIDYGRTLADAPEQLREPAFKDPGDAPAPLAIDPSNVSDRHNLSFANHVNTNSPISDSQVTAILESATQFFGKDDGANDTACCIEFKKDGLGKTFGSNGDGLDVITSSGELNVVIGNPIARVKVVDLIQWCGGPGSNIIGCGNTPGNGIVLVRISGVQTEGSLWVHEFGHNMGLGHNAKSTWVMYGFLQGSNVRLDGFECNRFHNPFGGGSNQPDEIGECDDDDNDLLVTTADNCPDVANSNQANADSDRLGDACDNCPFTSNQSQLDCDFDGQGDVCDASSPPVDTLADQTWLNPNRVTWDATQTPTEKDVLRGSLVGSEAWPSNESSVAQLPPTATLWQETETPAADYGLFYYLIEATNECAP